MIAVGTALRPSGSGRPPHRSERAELPNYRTLALGDVLRGVDVDGFRRQAGAGRTVDETLGVGSIEPVPPSHVWSRARAPTQTHT